MAFLAPQSFNNLFEYIGLKLPVCPGRSSSDMTTSTDPSSSEQSCDTVSLGR